MTTAVAAVDLGASSGRVVVGRIDGDTIALQEVHRFANLPVPAQGRLRWDVRRLFAGVLEGLHRATDRYGALVGVGVDGWAVDYGLLDGSGDLVEDPISYRDPGTAAAMADVLEQVGDAELYQRTGLQLQPFNTLFQLLARRDSESFRRARHALLVPDLVTYWLSGSMGTEVTNASTTQLLDPYGHTWNTELARELHVPVELFGSLQRPGAGRGRVRTELGPAAGTPVLTVPSHDTAAAVAGLPSLTDDVAFVCSGTWALVGLELAEPVIDEAARAANFTNEVGVDGRTRFLRNVTGFWLLQECLRVWGIDDVGRLTEQAADVPALRAVVDVQDERFASPGAMPERICAAAAASGARPSTPPEIVRCILDSIALAIRVALRTATGLTGRSPGVVHVVGGGVASPIFCQLVADACQLPVLAGPAEAASWGNVLSQARTLGLVPDSLAATRELIERATRPVTYVPSGHDHVWAQAARRLGHPD